MKVPATGASSFCVPVADDLAARGGGQFGQFLQGIAQSASWGRI